MPDLWSQRQKIKPAYYCEDGLELREYDYEKRPLLKVLILTQLYKTQSRQNQYLFMLAFSNILL